MLAAMLKMQNEWVLYPLLSIAANANSRMGAKPIEDAAVVLSLTLTLCEWSELTWNIHRRFDANALC